MIILDYRDRRPIYEQVISRFQELMLTGALEKDSQLPSVRSLAMELSINHFFSVTSSNSLLCKLVTKVVVCQGKGTKEEEE